MLSISTALSGVILHARLFVTGQLRNPWQTLGFRVTPVENHCVTDCVAKNFALIKIFAVFSFLLCSCWIFLQCNLGTLL